MGSQDLKQVQLAAAALAIALAALVIAITQLVGQLFATADGYRRCQSSVMGAWAQYTKLRWKWSQMRFETLFTTPEIFLVTCNPSVDSASKQLGQIGYLNWIGDFPGVIEYPVEHPPKPHHASIDCLDPELVYSDFERETHQELACWLPFLSSVRGNERELQLMKNYESATRYHTPRRPACRSVQRSWDFMAPELVRPLAVTYVGDIAVIVQRLGMKWQAFRPEEGEMRAEGNGHIIYSTLVRSIGPILHYAHELTRDMVLDKYKVNRLGGFQLTGLVPPELLFIPTGEVDMMRFGMLPCYEDFMHRKYYAMGTIDEVSATLDLLDPSGSASQKVRDNRQFVSTSTFGFPDLISMAAPILRQKGSTKIRLPVPTEHCTGLTSHKEGFIVFRQRLGEYVHDKGNEASPQILWVLKSYDNLKNTYSSWEDGIDEGVCENPSEVPFLDKVHDAWEQTTEYFQQLHRSDEINFQYAKMVAYHIKHAVNY